MEMSPFMFGLYKLAKFILYPLTWLILLIGVMTVLAFRPPSPRRWLRIRVLATTALVLSLVMGNSIVAGTLIGLIETQTPRFEADSSRHFDAIVVLGGGVYPKGSLRLREQLTFDSMVRTMCGVDLYLQGYAPQMVVSGGDASVFGEGPREAMEMKRFAMRLGVPDEAILIEDRSRTTYENAVETKRLLGPASIILTTSAYHMPRSEGLFRHQGLHVTSYPCSHSARNRPGDFSNLTPFHLIPTAESFVASTHAISELAGIWVYRLAGKL